MAETRWKLDGGDLRRGIEAMGLARRPGALLSVRVTGPRSPMEVADPEEFTRHLFAAWQGVVATLPRGAVGWRAGWSTFEFALEGSRADLIACGRRVLAVLKSVPGLADREWHVVLTKTFDGEPERTIHCDPGYALEKRAGKTAIVWVEPYAEDDWRESQRYPTLTFLDT